MAGAGVRSHDVVLAQQPGSDPGAAGGVVAARPAPRAAAPRATLGRHTAADCRRRHAYQTVS